MADGYHNQYHGVANVSPPPAPSEVRNAMYYFQANDGRNVRPKKPPFQPARHFNSQRRKMSERPLFTTHQRSPSYMTFGTEHDRDRYRHLDELTDTDETEMEFSDDSTVTSRPAKRSKMSPGKGDYNAPKWSNPDPYTSLPPINETNRKKRDMVKFIRKARNNPDTLHSVVEDVVTENQDFISFDMDGHYSVDDHNAAPLNAPVGPKSEREQRDSVLGKRKRLDDSLRPRTRPHQTEHIGTNIRQEWQATTTRSTLPWIKGQLDPTQSAGIA